MKEKNIKIPITYDQRIRNFRGKGYVPCEISSRWLQFPEQSAMVGGKELMFVDIMTYNQDGEDKKICNLCIFREDILGALSTVKLSEKG